MPLRPLALAVWLMAAHVSAQAAMHPTAQPALSQGVGAAASDAASTPSPVPPPVTTPPDAGAITATTATPTATDAVPASDAPDQPDVHETIVVDSSKLTAVPSSGPNHDVEADPFFYPSLALIGGGGAALLASLFTGMGAHGIYVRLERECKSNLCASTQKDKLDSGKTLAVVSTVLTGVGLVAAGVGVAMLVIAHNRTATDTPPESASLRLTGGPTGLGLGAAGSF